MRKTALYMLLEAAVLGMGGCGKANNQLPLIMEGQKQKQQKHQLNLAYLPVLWRRTRPPVPG